MKARCCIGLLAVCVLCTALEPVSARSAGQGFQDVEQSRSQIAAEQAPRNLIPEKAETINLSNPQGRQDTYVQFSEAIRPCVLRVISKHKQILASGVIVSRVAFLK